MRSFYGILTKSDGSVHDRLLCGVKMGMEPMTRIPCGAFWLGFALLVSVGQGHGADPPSEAPPEASACDDVAHSVARIQERYDGIRDLSADFEQVSQTVVMGGGASLEPTATHGKVVLAKPGRMLWSYLEPEPSFVISNGDVVWIYDVEGRQVTRVPVDRGYLAGAALQFLLGQGRLAETFRIEVTRCEGGDIGLELVPRAPASYERLTLTSEAATGLVTETSIVDLFGNRTSLRFSNIRVNGSPDPSVFEFTVPKGVELLEMEGFR